MARHDEIEIVALTAYDKEAKKHAVIAYGLLLLGFFTGIAWIAGGIWALVKKDDARNSYFEDHYNNIVYTFWWGLGISIIGSLLIFIMVGYFVLVAGLVWTVYRVIKGLARITSDKTYVDYYL